MGRETGAGEKVNERRRRKISYGRMDRRDERRSEGTGRRETGDWEGGEKREK